MSAESIPDYGMPVEPGDWRHRAACLDEDPEMFFPIGTTGPSALTIFKAKEICGSCAVRNECLLWSLEKGEEFGIWGGLTEDERRARKRRNGRQKSY